MFTVTTATTTPTTRTRLASAALLAAAALLGGAPHASAQFLIDPAGGTVLSSVGDDDGSYGSRSLGFTASVFGQPASAFVVYTNGSMNTPAGQSIAPMGTDLYVSNGQSIVEKTVPGQYYSVTWKCTMYGSPAVLHAQAIIFGAPMTLHGMNFQPNDIAFSFERVDASPWLAAVELYYAPTNTHVPVPGDADGTLTEANRALLPIFGTTGKVILFRPNGSGSYTRIVYPCPADQNKDGTATVQDIFDFLSAYFSGC